MYSYRHSVLYVDLCVYFREISPALLPCETCTVHSAKSSDRRPCCVLTAPLGRPCQMLPQVTLSQFPWDASVCGSGKGLYLRWCSLSNWGSPPTLSSWLLPRMEEALELCPEESCHFSVPTSVLPGSEHCKSKEEVCKWDSWFMECLVLLSTDSGRVS